MVDAIQRAADLLEQIGWAVRSATHAGEGLL